MYFVTGNPGKFTEAKRIIPELEQLAVDLPEIQDVDARVIIQAKLQAAYQKTHKPCVVDDTGMYLHCFEERLPGPLIKWFIKTIGLKGIANLAEKMDDVAAIAKVIIGYIDKQGTTHFFEGVTEGTIVYPRGNEGFGWDAIFQPEGFDQTFAEMSLEQKNAISPRGAALKKFKEFLDL